MIDDIDIGGRGGQGRRIAHIATDQRDARPRERRGGRALVSHQGGHGVASPHERARQVAPGEPRGARD